MKLDNLGTDDSATERDVESGEIALAVVELEAFVQADFEHIPGSRLKAVRERCLAQNIDQPD